MLRLQCRQFPGDGAHSVAGRAGCEHDHSGVLGHLEAAEYGALKAGQRADHGAPRRLITDVGMGERRSLIISEQPAAFPIYRDRHDHIVGGEPRQCGDETGLEPMPGIVLLEPHQPLGGRIAADHGPEASPVSERFAIYAAAMLGELAPHPVICGLRPLW